MKNFLLPWVLLLFLASCSDSSQNDEMQNNANIEGELQSRNYALTVDDLAKDGRVIELENALDEMKLHVWPQDKDVLLPMYGELHGIAHDMFLDYGEDLIIFGEELVNAPFSGACCDLSSDGVVDWSCCSGWEVFVVTIRSIDCSAPSSPDPVIREEQAAAFYECVQSIICRSC